MLSNIIEFYNWFISTHFGRCFALFIVICAVGDSIRFVGSLFHREYMWDNGKVWNGVCWVDKEKNNDD